jgi:uncharacterized protein with HEPN domain
MISFKETIKPSMLLSEILKLSGREASKNVPDEIKERFPEVPWDEMYLMRNRISHEYFGIDYEIIWDVSKNYLPENRKQILNVLSLLPG